jgi:hypothetical protein
MFPNYEKMELKIVDRFTEMSGVTFCPINFGKKENGNVNP